MTPKEVIEINKLKEEADITSDIIEKARILQQYHKRAYEYLQEVNRSKESSWRYASELSDFMQLITRKPKLKTSIFELDTHLEGGIESGQLIQLAGESFTGKTFTAMRILKSLCEQEETVFFNFEMSEQKIVKRMQDMHFTQKELNKLRVDSSSIKFQDLISEINLHTQAGVRLFVVDSLMKIVLENETDIVKITSHISKELSKMCRERNIIIIMINQMNEADIKDGRLSLKGGNAQTYDSDLIWFLVKDKQDKRWLVCTKNRQTDIFFKIDITYKKRETEIVYEMPII